MRKILLIILIFLLAQSNTLAQFAYRMSADIITRTRLADSTFQVSKGKIYYDKNYQKIVFDFTFPQKEQVVLRDTIMYIFNNHELKERRSSFLIPEQSVFHFMLSGNFTDFGLNENNFTASGIEKKEDLVITTWLAPEQLSPLVSKVLVATRNKQLYSMTMIDGEGKVMNRQLLKHYREVDGFILPTEILLATYLEKGSIYQIIQLDNLKINLAGNDALYNYEL